jgi:DNA-binding response OmpR family regulator
MLEKMETRARILAVDDDADTRLLLKMMLAGAGYEVALAADGELGWKSLSATLPDLLLTDIMMPVLDGFSLLKRVRADPRTCRLPVILLSAKASPDDFARGLRLGANDYLIKPFQKAEFLAKVRTKIACSALLVE